MITKANKIKKIIFSKLWEYDTFHKIKATVSKIKGLERSRWIKNGAIMKEDFKDCKTFLASTQKKGAIIEK
jgi:hypothetical protein